MKSRSQNKYEVNIAPDAYVYVISIVSDMVHIPIWTLRKLDEMGVVQPKRIGKKTRCYSQLQMQQLTYVRYLMDERGVNISGIKIILELRGKDKLNPDFAI